MKSAMQELIDYLQEMQDDDFDCKTQYIIENAIKAKEKEKHQLDDAFYADQIKGFIDFEQYYDKTYGS